MTTTQSSPSPYKSISPVTDKSPDDLVIDEDGEGKKEDEMRSMSPENKVVDPPHSTRRRNEAAEIGEKTDASNES